MLNILRRGVMNVVHGTNDVVNNILDHSDIKAISFVGSNNAGRYIYEVCRSDANDGNASLFKHFVSL
jgi:acyl-CoA reductase-like NAD-dependent aldehyde dehydrogenase